MRYTEPEYHYFYEIHLTVQQKASNFPLEIVFQAIDQIFLYKSYFRQ
jgi:hypothetical protein